MLPEVTIKTSSACCECPSQSMRGSMHFGVLENARCKPRYDARRRSATCWPRSNTRGTIALATRPLSPADRKHSTISGGTVVRWKHAVASWRNNPLAVVDEDVIARDKRAYTQSRRDGVSRVVHAIDYRTRWRGTGFYQDAIVTYAPAISLLGNSPRRQNWRISSELSPIFSRLTDTNFPLVISPSLHSTGGTAQSRNSKVSKFSRNQSVPPPPSSPKVSKFSHPFSATPIGSVAERSRVGILVLR